MSARVALPGRDAWVDQAFLLVLLGLALAGLAPTFVGWTFFAVGVAGALLGQLCALTSRVLGWPAVSAVLLGALLYYLLGGPLCLAGAGAALPGPHSARLLTDQALFGWKDLLTTLPPLDATGPLTVLPYLLGLAAGVLGGLLATVRARRTWVTAPLPVLAPLLLLAAVILLGVRRPQSLWLQGVAFALVALTWVALRHHRDAGAVRGNRSRRTRLALGGALLAAAGLLALPLGTWASGGDDGRVILRTYVSPPFDVGQYPSPLAAFRRYVKTPKPDPQNLYRTRLLTVDGVPAGARVRFATLDTYDGVVYGASNGNEPGPVDDTFQRVSSTIDNPVAGRSVNATVTLGPGWSGVWLPTVGALRSMHFLAGDTTAQEESFRYNLATSTGVVPTGLGPGDRYSFDAVLPDDRLTRDDEPGDPLADPGDGAFLDTQAAKWSEGAKQPMARVLAIAARLKKDGKYSDGVTKSEKIYHAGHNVARLSDDVGGINSKFIVGDDEQYAAWMALLANRVGVPARVVVGAVVPAGGVVRGKDVQAWVELRVGDDSWRTLPTSAFMSHHKPAAQPPQQQQQMTGAVVPPPQPIPPPSTAGEQGDTDMRSQKSRKVTVKQPGTLAKVEHAIAFVAAYVVLPVSVLLAVVGAIVGAKLLRRRRRRTASKVSARFVGGWRELVDHARDLGEPVPVGAGVTRREQSRTFATDAAPVLARRADGHVFGPRPPRPSDAEAFWREVDAQRHAMSSAVSPWRRVRAALSLRTFRG